MTIPVPNWSLFLPSSVKSTTRPLVPLFSLRAHSSWGWLYWNFTGIWFLLQGPSIGSSSMRSP
uniref:R.norvegicus mitochondrial D-loop region n=1 Tax=Rattus norvegicus TaxID=10116 RepID=V9H1H9_RAT|nr:unnamed protein product [Rattus norvegicus]